MSMTITNNQEDSSACPICREPNLTRVSCVYTSCRFSVTSCMRCDKAQAVAAFMADHEKDCTQCPAVVTASRPAFAAPSRAA